VLIEKPVDKTAPPQRPAWFPSTISEVRSGEITRKFFSKDSPFTSPTPAFSAPSHPANVKEPDPAKYALPTELEIGAVVRGSGTSSGGTGLTLEELLSHFGQRRPGKHGIREKVLEVVQRKCDLVDNGDKNYRWLKWKH
jgi:3-hydroxyisobutyryl-CoA hydrolase